MDDTVVGMENPGMLRPPPLAGITAFPDVAHPLGTLCFGGTLQGTMGTGFENMRRFPGWALVLVLSEGRYRDLRGNDRALVAGDVMVIRPDLPHQYGPNPGGFWSECFVVFEGPLAEAWRSHGLDDPRPVWHVGNPERWRRRFERIVRSPPRTRAAMGLRLGRFQALLAEVLTRRPDPHLPTWVAAAREALSQPRVDIAEVAVRLGYSPDGFRRAFRMATGITPSAFHRQARLRIAGRLLQRHDLSLEAIAQAAGFCDAFHLSKAWKQAHATSPRPRR